MKSGPSQSRSAWVQLYEARRTYNEPQSRPPGRPPSIVPRSKVGLTLSQGEISELEEWQTRFSNLLGRKVSIGETVGILSRICSTRWSQIGESEHFTDLAQLVEHMIGNK